MKKQKIADLGRRIGAQITDIVVTLPFLIVAFGFAIAVMPGACLLSLIGYLAFIIFNDVYLVATKGYTIGKKATGVRIVSDSKAPGFGKAFARFAMKELIFILGIIGAALYIISILSRDDKRSIADLAAGTSVVEVEE